MLVGLVAKNAILIVEFAKDEVEKGNNAVDAVIKAAHLRFRPIVMTSLAFILGMLPLVFASGGIGQSSRYRYRRIFRYDCGNYRRHYFCSPSFRMGLQVKI